MGVGLSLRKRRHAMPLEVHCCTVRPGSGQLILTGCSNDTIRECVGIAEHVVSQNKDVIGARLGVAVGAAPFIIRGRSEDLHVHLIALGEDVRHTEYMAAMVISLVSLMIGKRPPSDVAAFGEVAYTGLLSPADFIWTDKIVGLCRQQGIRRIVLAPNSTIKRPEAEAAASAIDHDDGRPVLQFMRYGNILDALSEIFTSVEVNALNPIV